jgi:hypothetical protein
MHTLLYGKIKQKKIDAHIAPGLMATAVALRSRPHYGTSANTQLYYSYMFPKKKAYCSYMVYIRGLTATPTPYTCRGP